MLKKCVAFIMLVCAGNLMYCMDENEWGHRAFSTFVHSGCENPERIASIEQECFKKRPFMTRQQFINCFRPAVGADGHPRAAVFPLEFIDKIWNRYVALNKAIFKSHFHDEYGALLGSVPAVDLSNLSGSFEFLETLFPPNLYGANHKLLGCKFVGRVDLDNTATPRMKLFDCLAQGTECFFAKGFNVVVLVDYNHALDIIFANHDNIVLILSLVNAYQSRDKDQILHSVDDAINNGRIQRFNSLATAINAYRNSLA